MPAGGGRVGCQERWLAPKHLAEAQDPPHPGSVAENTLFEQQKPVAASFRFFIFPPIFSFSLVLPSKVRIALWFLVGWASPPYIRSTGRDRGNQTGGWLAGRRKRRVAGLRANEQRCPRGCGVGRWVLQLSPESGCFVQVVEQEQFIDKGSDSQVRQRTGATSSNERQTAEAKEAVFVMRTHKLGAKNERPDVAGRGDGFTAEDSPLGPRRLGERKSRQEQKKGMAGLDLKEAGWFVCRVRGLVDEEKRARGGL